VILYAIHTPVFKGCRTVSSRFRSLRRATGGMLQSRAEKRPSCNLSACGHAQAGPLGVSPYLRRGRLTVNRQNHRSFLRSLLVCLLILLMAGGTACRKEETREKAHDTAEGWKAPSFVLNDLQGRTVRFSDFSGKVVIVNFWASWCGPCRMEIPQLVDLYNRFRARGVVVIGIAIDPAGPEVLSKFAREMQINYSLLVGDEKVFYDFGGLVGLPTTFVINQQGMVVDKYVGLIGPDVLERRVLSLLR